MYTLVATLDGYTNSITTTQFSPDKAYLASGSEDGSLSIHSVSNWEPLLRFVDASPITSLVWHPTSMGLLLCGCKSGDVHTIRFSASSVCSRYHQHRTSVLTNKTQKDVRMWTDETPDQIQCLAHHKRKNSLAVGCGNDVLLVDYETSEEGKSSWTRKTTLPSPPRLPGSNGFLPNPIARSISFLKGNHLLVSYLDHGIV